PRGTLESHRGGAQEPLQEHSLRGSAGPGSGAAHMGGWPSDLRAGPVSRLGLDTDAAGGPGPPRRGFYERVIAILILGLLLYAVLGILRPLLASIVWGITLCVATWPVFLRLRRMLGGRAVAASLAMALLLLLVFVTPLVIIGASLGDAVDGLS